MNIKQYTLPKWFGERWIEALESAANHKKMLCYGIGVN